MSFRPPSSVQNIAVRSLVLCALATIGIVAGVGGFSHATASTSWTGDFETGDWSQFDPSNLQVVSGGSADIQSSVVRQGRYAARFSTPTYDGTNRSRSQIYLDSSSSYGNEGQENWFAWSTMIAPGSRLEKGGWNNLTSFHQKDNHNTCPAPDHFAVTNAHGMWFLRLDSSGGRIDFSTCRSPSERSWSFGRIRTGTWYDVVFHVKWSADPRVGFVEVWLNGRRVLPRTRAATLYEGDGIYLKQGYDGGGADGTTTVYNDGTVIARTFAAAVAALRSR
jgi:hypothetical protein